MTNPSLFFLTTATCQTQFEQGVAIALHLWPALSLAVQNNWGGPDSADKRDWFAGAIVDLFPDLNKVLAPQQSAEQQQQQTAQKKTTNNDDHEEATEEPDQLDIETVLLQVMLDEFEVNVDDDSAFEVAEQILRVRLGCLKGKFDEVDALRRRFEGKSGGKNVVFKKAEDQDDDTDWDTDDDEEDGDSDEEMGEAPALVPTQPKEKVEPEVDEDGFTKVVGKKRR